MSQGYALQLSVNGNQVQFQNVSVRFTSDDLDTSSSLNGDGSPNEGFTDRDGDLANLVVEIDSIIKDARVESLMALFEPGARYPGMVYTVTYGDLELVGNGIYVMDQNMTFNIPGAARLRMTFTNLQTGYEFTE